MNGRLAIVVPAPSAMVKILAGSQLNIFCDGTVNLLIHSKRIATLDCILMQYMRTANAGIGVKQLW